MNGILEIVAVAAITKAANMFIDWGLARSKRTKKNSVDDFIFGTLDALRGLTKYIKFKK